MTLTPQLSSFQFSNYRLLKFAFELNKEFEQSEAEDDLHYNLSIKSSVRELTSSGATDGGRQSVVKLDISVLWSKEDGPFKLDLSCDGVFSCPSSMDMEQYKSLCELHAPALLYTQLRPLTRMIAAEAGETFTLPLINISETLKKARAEKAAPSKKTVRSKKQ